MVLFGRVFVTASSNSLIRSHIKYVHTTMTFKGKTKLKTEKQKPFFAQKKSQ
jgi:hypothetical protein